MKLITTIFLLAITLISPRFAPAQATYMSTESNGNKLIQRYALQTGKFHNGFFTDILPYNLKSAGSLIKMLDTIQLDFTIADRYNISYLKSDNLPWSPGDLYGSRKPFLGHFYKSKANFFQVNEKGINLFINPGLYLMAANASEDDKPLYTNTRVVEIRGDIDGKLGFYTFIAENQIRPAGHEMDFYVTYGSYPGAHLTKRFKEDGVDFFQARGYITFSPIKYITLQFGQDRNFIGYGKRSLLLSDFATDYLFLKANTNVWRFNYMNLFARLTDRYWFVTKTARPRPYPAKYMAMHYLSINILPNLNIGLFEAVTFHDNEGTGRGFDLHYLNPIIFYRSVEHQLGDPDKMLVGFNLGYIPFNGFQFYGQFMLNEFHIGRLRSGEKHHSNKYGYQAGLKYLDIAGISNLDMQLEYNRVRPYSYTHFTISGDYPVNSYSHYNQPLAHPLGANFSEWIVTFEAQPFPRLTSGLHLVHAVYGADTAGSNWGGNIYLDYRTHEREFGNVTGQGVKTNLLIAEAWLSYQLRHNLFIDLDIRYRHQSNELPEDDNSNLFIGTALRLNLVRRNWQF